VAVEIAPAKYAVGDRQRSGEHGGRQDDPGVAVDRGIEQVAQRGARERRSSSVPGLGVEEHPRPADGDEPSRERGDRHGGDDERGLAVTARREYQGDDREDAERTRERSHRGEQRRALPLRVTRVEHAAGEPKEQ